MDSMRLSCKAPDAAKQPQFITFLPLYFTVDSSSEEILSLNMSSHNEAIFAVHSGAHCSTSSDICQGVRLGVMFFLDSMGFTLPM